MNTVKLPAHAIPRSALLFMAAVEEARKSNEGSFRAIAPIFRIALEGQAGEVLNLERATKILRPILGDGFTHQTFEAFVPQLERLEWLKRTDNGEVSAYLVSKTFPEFNSDEAQRDSLKRLEEVFLAFKEFIAQHAPLLNLTVDKDQFKWNLFLWSVSLDGSDKDAIKTEATKLLSGERPSLRFVATDEPQRFSAVDPILNIEFAAFCKWLAKGSRNELETIASLTELGLAYEFLSELKRPTATADLKVECLFILDAPVLLDLLGLSGPSRQLGIERSMAMLAEHGGQFATLSHCLQELSDILKAVLAKSRKFGLTGDAIRADKKLVGVARSTSQNPDKAAKAKGVQVVAFDRRNVTNERYFPDALIDRFRSRANWHDFYKTNQRERDALSVAFVMRRRAGSVNSDVLESKAVLVARNSTYASFSKAFITENLNEPDFATGPVIETKTLSAMTWLRYGSEADQKFPQIQLIAACDRILATNGVLLRKAEKKLREISDEDTVEALLSSQQAVMDLVVGVGANPDVLDGADAAELLKTVTSTAEERGKALERDVTNQVRATLEAERTDWSVERENLRGNSIKLAAEKEKAEITAAKLRESEAERRRRLADRIEVRATRISWAISISLWTTSLVAALYSQFYLWSGPDMWSKEPIFATLSLVLCIVALLPASVFFQTDQILSGQFTTASARGSSGF